MNLKQMQNRKAALVKEGQELLSKAQAENRDLSTEEKAAFDKTEADIKAVNEGIAREEKLAAWQRELAPAVQTATLAPEPKADEPKKIRIEGIYTKPKHFEKAEDAYLCGRFLRAVATRNAADAEYCREHGLQMLAASGAHSSNNNATGGVLIPDVLSNTIINLKEQYGKFRQNARKVPMTSDSILFPRRVSGLTTYYVAENTDTTTSKIGLDGVQLSARKLTAAAVYPMELAADAVISLADLLAEELAYAFAKAEDEAGFNGDGTSTYGGITGLKNAIGAGGIKDALSGNVSFETFDMEDFLGAMGKLPEYAIANAKWYISQAGYHASMARLLSAGGGNTMMDLSGKPSLQFLGYPVVICQCLNSTLGSETSTIKAYFGDLSLSSTVGDRQGFAVSSDSSLYFLADQIVIKGTQRFDIVNHDVGTASAAGPVVALKTASG